MKVKICGITRSQDVSKCEGSGANLIGFIYTKDQEVCEARRDDKISIRT